MTTAYRHAGKAHSPALERLAEQARGRDVIPDPTSRIPESQRRRRLALAVEVTSSGNGTYKLIGAGVTFVSLLFMNDGLGSRNDPLLVFGVLLLLVGIGFFLGGVVWMDPDREKLFEEKLAWANTHPFPVSGLRAYLVSDRSLLVVRMKAPLDPATMLAAISAVDPSISARSIDASSYELEIPPRKHIGNYDEQYGDFPLLKKVFAQLVLPVHGDVGVERVALGGTVNS
jgi:hypothetical protein